MFPHTKEEKALIKKGYYYIAGIDEAGRGALAGPVVAAAVVMPLGKVLKAKDSKLLSPKRRDELYDEILDSCHGFGVGIVGNYTIDDINIYQASRLAMKKAVEAVQSISPDHLIIDAMSIESSIPQKPIVGGDTICYSISCASIIAKVTRDRLMEKLHKKYPEYCFDQHKGYGTKKHKEALDKHGFCNIHRKTFSPINKMV